MRRLNLSRVDGLLIGLLAGWYLFASESLLTNPADRVLMVKMVFAIVVLGFSFVRFLVYRDGYAPPISLWGRIRTFRWIVPGYDQVFLAPLCTLLVGILAFDRFRPPGLDDLTFLPIATLDRDRGRDRHGPKFDSLEADRSPSDHDACLED